MADDFTEWELLNRRRQIARREGLCTCCAFIHRAGDPGPRPVRAVVMWNFENGNQEQLCESCAAIWQKNADADPGMRPLSVTALAGA